MEPRFRAPRDLVVGLQQRSRDARRQLGALLHAPVDRLMGDLIDRHGLEDSRDLLTAHALQLAENHLRFRDAAGYAGLSWDSFRAGLLVQLTRLALQPLQGPRSHVDPTSPVIPGSSCYQSEVFHRPYARMGNQFFGGDWCAGRELPDGSLWVLLADVTGHGYYAFLLARGLHAVWQECWDSQSDCLPEPAVLLAYMHRQLADCLPEGTYLECTLARLGPDGRTTVVPAGGSRLLVRKGQARPVLVQLRGTWLGLSAPGVEEQYELHLGPGDEVVLTTDGALEQLEGQGGLEGLTNGHGLGRTTLLAALRERIEAALEAGPQLDDITLVLVRRRGGNGGGDVRL